MHEMDAYSYHCGVIDAFCEMVSAGVKGLALSHPFPSKEEALRCHDFVISTCAGYQISYVLEEDILLTDLFPASANEGLVVYLFYQKQAVIEQYIRLKERKQCLLKENAYTKKERVELALAMGQLLSYEEEECRRRITENLTKENING